MSPNQLPRPFATLLCSAALLCAWGAAQAAGRVEVQWTAAEQYADAGRSVVEQERHLEQLGAHFKALAARLGDGQLLRIEVRDVDLAGETRLLRRLPDEVRVLRGSVDWPRIELSWSLQEAGRTLASGEDRLSDMNYLMHSARVNTSEALPYEARMITRWFAERPGKAAGVVGSR